MYKRQVDDGLLEIGNQLPMSDNQGNRLVGVVKDVKDDVVTMDFNHPMAGKSLDFKGQVVEVREATPEELGPMNACCGCGDGCGDGCEDGCGDKEHKGGCSCGCH